MLSCLDFVEPGTPSMPQESDPIVCHRHSFEAGYDTSRKDPYWVAYHLTGVHVKKHKYERTDVFIQDPSIDSDRQARVSDYAGSGFDRGHMDPAADNQWGEHAEEESFYLTNVTPQVHNFNAGIWAALEADERKWAILRGNVYIITGPIIKEPSPTIGDGHVAVPASFYKIIYDQNTGEIISFIIPHAVLSQGDLAKYLVSEKEVENETGITFLSRVDEPAKEKKPTELWPLS